MTTMHTFKMHVESMNGLPLIKRDKIYKRKVEVKPN